jgi:DHA2 family multidrug resistance protein
MNDRARKVNPWLIAAAVVLPAFMEVLDTTIVSVALNYIAGSLATSVDDATWVSTSYLISNAVVLPVSAWLAAHFGRKRYFIVSITVFTIASFLCGVAPSLGFLVLARIVQGAGGGAMQPLSQAILMEAFPPEKRGQAMAAWGMAVVVAPVLGPLLGGWITYDYSWPWAFFINIPVGVVAIWLIHRYVSDPAYVHEAKPGRIDAIGFGFLTLWLATQQIVLDKGQDDDWFSALWIRWFTIISVVSLIAFVIWEMKTDSPIVNLRILKNRNFRTGCVLAVFVGVIIYSPTTLLPTFLQNLLNYSSLQSGMAQYTRGIGSLLVLPFVGILSGKVDNRIFIVVGLSLAGTASLMFGNITLQVAETNFNLANFVQGMGISMTFVPLITTTMGLLRKEEMGNATGLFNLMRNLGGSIGISLATTFQERGALAHQALLTKDLTPGNPVYQGALQSVQSYLSTGVDAAQARLMAPGVIYQSLLQQANFFAYVDVFRLLALVSFTCVLGVFLMKKVSPKGALPMH